MQNYIVQHYLEYIYWKLVFCYFSYEMDFIYIISFLFTDVAYDVYFITAK